MSFNVEQNSYQEFRGILKEKSGKVICFVGAGLSKPLGLPLWGELYQSLHDIAKEEAEGLDDAPTRVNALNSLSAIEDPWLKFELLRERMGRTSYESCIKNELKTTSSHNTGHYDNIWKLGFNGILSLNIDPLAELSYRKNKKSRLATATGFYIKDRMELLNTNLPFLINLHGSYDSTNTWVFTKDELNQLMGNPSYQHFIQTIFSTSTILFLGITATDRAAGGHLDNLTKLGIKGPHYWLTDNTEPQVHQWAQNRGVRLIKYKKDEHSEIDDFYNDLKEFQSEDTEEEPPVYSNKNLKSHRNLPDAKSLMLKVFDEDEYVREILNSKAAHILNTNTQTAYGNYSNFCREYQKPIHAVSLVEEPIDQNIIMGYQLQYKIGGGSFGEVFHAIDEEGNEVAVKMLIQKLRTNDPMLQSFRRGVRSMRHIENQNIKGVVKFIDAYEIPSIVIMEFIKGKHLKDARESKIINDLDSIMKVINDLSTIINNTHTMEERVYHRDLRPENIMLRGENLNNGDWEVVVLDFDLSHHKHSQELSIIDGQVTHGYPAPEQIDSTSKVSTRHSAVDSFGFGMTLYYLLSKKDPLPGQHKYEDWNKVLNNLTNQVTCKSWRSLPKRLIRLIEFCTKDKQWERADFPYVYREIQRLNKAIRQPDLKEIEVDLIAEELISSLKIEYLWDPDKLSGTIKTTNGSTLKVIGEPNDQLIEIKVSIVDEIDMTPIKKFQALQQKMSDIHRSIFNNSQWDTTSPIIEHKHFSFSATKYKKVIKLTEDKQFLKNIQERFFSQGL